MLQAELDLFSNGEPSHEHAVGALGDSCVMTSKQPDPELMGTFQSNTKLIKRQQIFVYLLIGEEYDLWCKFPWKTPTAFIAV